MRSTTLFLETVASLENTRARALPMPASIRTESMFCFFLKCA
jgi:hypothetical protein